MRDERTERRLRRPALSPDRLVLFVLVDHFVPVLMPRGDVAAEALGVFPLLGAARAEGAGLERVPDVPAAVGRTAPGIGLLRLP